MRMRIVALVSDEINIRVSVVGYKIASFQNWLPLADIPAKEIVMNENGSFGVRFDTRFLETRRGNMKPIFEVVED